MTWKARTFANHRMMHWVMEHAPVLQSMGLGGSPVLTLMTIAMHADHQEPTCWLSYSTMSTESTRSRRTCIDAVDALEAAGVIQVLDRHPSGSNQYRLVIDFAAGANSAPVDEIVGANSAPASAGANLSEVVQISHQQDKRRCKSRTSASAKSAPVDDIAGAKIAFASAKSAPEVDIEIDPTSVVPGTRSGGAGGRAPASRGKIGGNPEEDLSGRETLCDSFFSSEQKQKPNPNPNQIPNPSPDPTSTPQSPSKPIPVPAPAKNRAAASGFQPRYRDGQEPGPPPNTMPRAAKVLPQDAPSRPDDAWDTLDYVMGHYRDSGEFAGHPWKQVCRAVFFHWKVTDRPYWNTDRGDVTSPARLEKVIGTMIEQMPADFVIPGSATEILPSGPPYPECTKCKGYGTTVAPHPRYAQDIDAFKPWISVPCECAIANINHHPWRTWTK